PPDADGNVFCPHTGVDYTFSENDQSITFRRDDSDRSTAALIQPASWYDNLFWSAPLRAAAQYLYHKEGISRLTASNAMGGPSVELRPDEGDGAACDQKILRHSARMFGQTEY